MLVQEVHFPLAEEGASTTLDLDPILNFTIPPALMRMRAYFEVFAKQIGLLTLTHLIFSFPDNDGAGGHKPADEVDYTCSNTAVTLTLCPGTTSHYPKK